jgi:hypothetical protein
MPHKVRQTYANPDKNHNNGPDYGKKYSVAGKKTTMGIMFGFIAPSFKMLPHGLLNGFPPQRL